MNEPLHDVTPLWRSASLTEALGETVRLKMDCFQPVGSFKIRGMGRRCVEAARDGARAVVTSSGGNAGYAIAYACDKLDMRCIVVVPRTTSEFMRSKVRAFGAEVFEHGDSWDDAHAHALSLVEEAGAVYVHPFDDPIAWEGHSTVIDEAAEQGPKPGIVVVAVGGGGLLCGVLAGMKRVGWNDVPVLAVETVGAASFLAAATAGRPVTLDAIRSLATTLGARTVTPELLRWKERHEILHWTATDRQAVDACIRFAEEHRVLVEPACGAALAAVYERCLELRGRGPVLVEVCGGAGVNLQLLQDWDQQAG